MKLFITCSLFFFTSISVCAQYVNQNVNQNINNNSNTIIIQNQPVIEKKVYIERYRTIYKDRPQPKRIAKTLPSPVCLLGYLWVYPEDLGTYNSFASDIISRINAQGLHGRNDWRIPTPDELRLMENYADKCGLGSDIYLATDHRNGVLRLVSSGKSIAEQRQEQREKDYQEMLYRQQELANAERIKIEARAKQNEMVSFGQAYIVDGIIWDYRNKGANNSTDKGVFYSSNNVAVTSGWRLPTESEFYSIIRQSRNDGHFIKMSNGLTIPIGVYAVKLKDGTIGYINLSNGFKGTGSINTLIRLVQDRL